MKVALVVLSVACFLGGCTELAGGDDEPREEQAPRVEVPAQGGRTTASASVQDNGELVRAVKATVSTGNYDPDPEKEERITVYGTDESRKRQAFAGVIRYELQRLNSGYPSSWKTIGTWTANVQPGQFADGAYVYTLQHDDYERLQNCSYRVAVHVTFEATGYTYDADTSCFY